MRKTKPRGYVAVQGHPRWSKAQLRFTSSHATPPLWDTRWEPPKQHQSSVPPSHGTTSENVDPKLAGETTQKPLQPAACPLHQPEPLCQPVAEISLVPLGSHTSAPTCQTSVGGDKLATSSRKLRCLCSKSSTVTPGILLFIFILQAQQKQWWQWIPVTHIGPGRGTATEKQDRGASAAQLTWLSLPGCPVHWRSRPPGLGPLPGPTYAPLRPAGDSVSCSTDVGSWSDCGLWADKPAGSLSLILISCVVLENCFNLPSINSPHLQNEEGNYTYQKWSDLGGKVRWCLACRPHYLAVL